MALPSDRISRPKALKSLYISNEILGGAPSGAPLQDFITIIKSFSLNDSKVLGLGGPNLRIIKLHL